jgi:hypothetical protein
MVVLIVVVAVVIVLQRLVIYERLDGLCRRTRLSSFGMWPVFCT